MEKFIANLGGKSVIEDKSFRKQFGGGILYLLVILILLSYAAYKTSHYLFRPLRDLNAKMRTILNEANSSKEID